MASPSVYFPDTFVLDDGPVSEISTSETFPKATFSLLGLSLPWLPVQSSPGRVWWQDALGVLKAYVRGWQNGLASSLDLGAISDGSAGSPAPNASMKLEATVSNGPAIANARLLLQATKAGAAGLFGWITAQAGAKSLVILRDDGSSDFVQVAGGAGVANLAIDGGQSAAIGWLGGNPISNTLTIAHSLGRVPKSVVAIGSGSTWSLPIVFARTANDFQVRLRTTDGTLPPAGTTDSVYWIAIG